MRLEDLEDELGDGLEVFDFDGAEDEGPALCSACNGSGEGAYDGSTCRACRGRGELPARRAD